MAEIFLARQESVAGFARPVVVKRLLPHLADDPNHVAMFLDEARVMAALAHPNLAQVCDAGLDGGRYFYAMEYLEGCDLGAIQNLLEQRAETMPLGHALFVIMSVAAGLHAAHELCDEEGRWLGVVHRDVSPGNVFITDHGGVKLIDFGVAKSNGQRSSTEPGVVKGKLAFMSPEQLTCRELDRRSDVFSLGILLYELTTGARLFGGFPGPETVRRIVEGPTPQPSEACPGYPAPLEEVVRMTLARDPDGRLPTAAAVIDALDAAARVLGVAIATPWQLARWLGELTDDEPYESLAITFPDEAAPADRLPVRAPIGAPQAGGTPTLPLGYRPSQRLPPGPPAASPVRVEFRAPRGTNSPPAGGAASPSPSPAPEDADGEAEDAFADQPTQPRPAVRTSSLR